MRTDSNDGIRIAMEGITHSKAVHDDDTGQFFLDCDECMRLAKKMLASFNISLESAAMGRHIKPLLKSVAQELLRRERAGSGSSEKLGE